MRGPIYRQSNNRQLQGADQLKQQQFKSGLAIVIKEQANPWSFQTNICLIFYDSLKQVFGAWGSLLVKALRY